jgi:hypothetical protein
VNPVGPVRSASGLDHYLHRAPTGAKSAPIIALHPWFGCWQFWLPVVELFGERDWVLVDLFGEPEAVRRFVANGARDLAAQDRVLVSQYKQFGVLGAVAAQQHRRDRQQPPGHLVQQ